MPDVDIYSSVLDYMCDNYDYSLYATDFNANRISSLQRAIASVPTAAGSNRADAIKIALQDFFNAIFQKIFVYEDEERLKIVKYFDTGASSENEDRQIHELRQELLKYKEEIKHTFSNNTIHVFEKTSRRRFEMVLIGFRQIHVKNILREQIRLVYDLESRDIVIFLNKKIFLKKFDYKYDDKISKESLNILCDQRFIDSLWEEVNLALKNSIDNGFNFLMYESREFYEKYPAKFFSIVEKVVKLSFSNMSNDEINYYANIVFNSYTLKMLKEIAKYVFDEVLESNLRAIKFLKQYSEGTKLQNRKMKLNKAPLMDSKGNMYNYKTILAILKSRELLCLKITHKNIEMKNIQARVHKSQVVVRRSIDEMDRIKRRRLELLVAIEQVEDEIGLSLRSKAQNNIDINRLEFSKRDLLEAFKQVEINAKTQINILNNTKKDLEKWRAKREEKRLAKDELLKEQMTIEKNYSDICEVLAVALKKEPVKL